LNKQISEEDLMACIEGVTYIKWITDKQTGEFYGSTFVEMKDPKAAIDAIAKDKQKFMGRPLKIYYCPPRPGDVWPPKRGVQYERSATNDDATTNSGQNAKRGPPRRERTPKPAGCTKLYMGNLSYNIDDDTICEFFKDCGEIIGLRWLIREGTNEFRGGGYIQFATTEQCDAAIQKDGLELLGRPIKLDYTT
jgi:nucleolin